MHVAQSGIFALGTGSHSLLEFDLLASVDPFALVRAIATLREPRTTTGGVNLVVGFRPPLWRRVSPQETPEAVTDFEQDVRGIEGFTMPATQHDLWVWAAGHAYDTVFDVAKEAMQALTGLATLALNVVLTATTLPLFLDPLDKLALPGYPYAKGTLATPVCQVGENEARRC